MMTAAVLIAACAGWLAVGAGSAPARRLDRDRPDADVRTAVLGQAQKSLVESTLARTALCVGSGLVVGLALSGPAAALAGGAAGALASWLIGRLEPPSARRRRESIERDLPLAIDLLAACAIAGRPVEGSMDLVATAVGGPLRQLLSERSARISLGADPLAEWSSMRQHPQLGPMARAVLRSMESGAPIADTLERLAVDSRGARAAALQRRARSVGVRAAGPLGICFLPAFMLVGIVPTVVGGFTHLVL
jgi:pilus assembly protein TadC